MTRSIFLLLMCFITGEFYAQDLIPPVKATSYKAVVIANVQGDVKVTTTNTDQIKVTGVIETDSDTKKKVSVKTVTVNDTLVVYVESPLAKLKINQDENFVCDSWSVYDWRSLNNCEETLEFTIDMTVSIPDNIPLSLSTINEGKITVDKRQGPLWVNNVNGSIMLKDVSDLRRAKTVNGDVDLYFKDEIRNDGEFYTLNGNINAYYPSGSDVNFTFKSFNGDFYTDTDLETLPSMTSSRNETKGFKLKISESIRMKMGQGGSWHHFETFNGDAIIRSNNL